MKILNFKKTSSYIFKLYIVFCFLFFATSVSASNIFFDKNSSQVVSSQVFRVDLILNTDNKNINAFESSIFFDKDLLEVYKILDGGSVVNYWIKTPRSQGDQIFFSGITPGGVSGEYNKILSIVFIAKKDGLAKIELKNTKLLLNDGNATEDYKTINNLYVDVLKQEMVPSKVEDNNTSVKPVSPSDNINKEEDVTAEEVDSTRPEKFDIKIIKDRNINSGGFSLIFYAQDKGSGVDYYEVKEGNGDFVRVESPYLLKQQDLTEEVQVKVVDKSGNYRIETIGPIIIKEKKSDINYNLIIGSLLFSIFVLILMKLYFDKKHKTNEKLNNKVE